MQTLSEKQLCQEFRHSYNSKVVIYLISFQLKQIVDIYKVPSDLLTICPKVNNLCRINEHEFATMMFFFKIKTSSYYSSVLLLYVTDTRIDYIVLE